MFEFRTYRVLAVLTSLVLLVSACSPAAQNESAIATAVAQTVQAGEVIPVVTVLPSNTPQTAPGATLTPAITPTSAPTDPSAPSDPDCIHANLVSEYPPDGAVYRPGDSFTKTWTIKNEGTCAWDSSYKLIFWSGELMGGATYYNLPETVPPGDDISISILLQAPATEGFFTGYWRLQTPWNANFGVGQYSQAFYANIQVDRRPGQEYGITTVTYEILRDPPTGCPVNVRYTVNATITTNGEFDFLYYWEQSDGNESAIKELVFNAAGSKTVSRMWMVGRGDSPNPRWMQIVTTFPELHYYDKAVWENNCP